MNFVEIMNWIEKDFPYDIPQDYLNFLEKGDFSIGAENVFIIYTNGEFDGGISIHEWCNYENLISSYENEVEDFGMKDYYLPIFSDEGGVSVAINCYPDKHYGNLVIVNHEAVFDADKSGNSYVVISNNFSDFMSKLTNVDSFLKLLK